MWAGRAYFKVSKFQDALTAWQHQVVVAKDNHGPDSTELGAAYHNVAHALQATGDLQQASSYYEQALNIFEKAHKDAPDLSLYSEALRSVLRNYALLLRQMGNQARADALDKEAASIPQNQHGRNESPF